MKILVTGGAGFIGSAVVLHITRNTQDIVVNLDKLSYAGNLEALAEAAASERYVCEQVDICNRSELDRVFALHQPDAVMHLAAESHVDRSITGPDDFIETNIVGTYTLLEAARAYWNDLDETRKAAFRFHHISTDEVYGDLPHPDEVAAGEALSLFPETTPRPEQSLFSLQGIERPSGARLASDIRAAHSGYQLLEQFRALATCGKTDFTNHSPRPRGQADPSLWQGRSDPRLALRRRSCSRALQGSDHWRYR